MTASPFDQLVTFVRVSDLARSSAFYHHTLGLPLARDQGSCHIFRVAHGGFFGVCEGLEGEVHPGTILTFVTNDVDGVCERLQAQGVTIEEGPRSNPRYNIYHAFLRDPDGYLVEIQRFEEPLV